MDAHLLSAQTATVTQMICTMPNIRQHIAPHLNFSITFCITRNFMFKTPRFDAQSCAFLTTRSTKDETIWT